MPTPSGQIKLPARMGLALALWFIAELWAFVLVVSYLGFAGALLLGLVTSLIGFTLLRRLGQSAASNLRRVFGQRGLVLETQSVLDGTIAGLGGLLLILPGFLSDLLGLALSAPSIRGWIAARVAALAGRQPQHRSRVIDLNAQEWRRLDDTAPDLSGRS